MLGPQQNIQKVICVMEVSHVYMLLILEIEWGQMYLQHINMVVSQIIQPFAVIEKDYKLLRVLMAV